MFSREIRSLTVAAQKRGPLFAGIYRAATVRERAREPDSPRIVKHPESAPREAVGCRIDSGQEAKTEIPADKIGAAAPRKFSVREKKFSRYER